MYITDFQVKDIMVKLGRYYELLLSNISGCVIFWLGNISGFEYSRQSSSKRSKIIQKLHMTSQFSNYRYSKTSMIPHALIIIYHTGIEILHIYSALVLNFTKSHEINLEFHNFKDEESFTYIHKKAMSIINKDTVKVIVWVE